VYVVISTDSQIDIVEHTIVVMVLMDNTVLTLARKKNTKAKTTLALSRKHPQTPRMVISQQA
jgi:hypothetical protein